MTDKVSKHLSREIGYAKSMCGKTMVVGDEVGAVHNFTYFELIKSSQVLCTTNTFSLIRLQDLDYLYAFV